MRENHVAQIAPGGTWRVWAEDETGGEAYVPLAMTKRPRSKAIVEEVVDRFGGDVEWYADGGIRGSMAARARSEKELQRAIDRLEKFIGKNTDRLEKLQQTRSELQRDTAGNFLNDPFEDNATLAGALRSLDVDRRGASSHKWQAQRVRALGLSGEVYRELLASGNTAVLRDVNTRGEVKALESAWWRRRQATTGFTVGAFPNGPGVDTIKELQATNKQLRGTLNQLTKELRSLRSEVREGAREGTAAGTSRRQRARNQAARRAR
jgi:hypothetical protein